MCRYTCTASNGYSDAEDSVDISVEQIQVGALPYHIIAYSAISYHTIPYFTIQYHTIPYRTVNQSINVYSVNQPNMIS